MKKIMIATLTGAALLLSTAAFADEAAELTTAQTHAGLAAKGTTIDMVHMHLHHSLNCLVGPGGTGFDTTNANPCAKSGNGAIPDSTDAAQKAKLTSIAASAKTGVGSSDLATVQQAAKDTVAAVAAAK